MSEISTTSSGLTAQLDDPSRAVQVQVLPPQAARGTDANGTIVHTVTPTAQTNASSILSSVAGQAALTPEVSAQITQLTGLRLPADQQKLLLAAQLQQLTKTSTGAPLSANAASFVIQSAFPTSSITVVSSAPDSTAKV